MTTINCKLHGQKSSLNANLDSLNQTISLLDNPSILGANTDRLRSHRYSYWGFLPIEIFEFSSCDSGPFNKLDRVIDKYKLDSTSESLPMLPEIFCGGWIGYFGYELGRFIEKLPQNSIDDLDLPLIRLCFYDKFIAFDHLENCFWLMALNLDGDKQSIDSKFNDLENVLADACQITCQNKPKSHDGKTIDISQFKSNMTKTDYFEAIAKIKKYIYDGQVYQINFSQRFDCDFAGDATGLFHWQNANNPCSNSAYIDCQAFQIISTSPELFVNISSQTRKITTCPIKGTRPRLSQANGNLNKTIESTNAKNLHDLANSSKEQAELNMIIDLERNDLGRICQYGSINVTSPRTIEEYPTVFHALAEISGTLRDEVTFSDILRATFPGGSITGAPKISAMEIIDQLEPTCRGVYTGAIGFLGIDGSANFNIAIRTIITKDRFAFVQTGGGIVADSIAENEWDETITKASALLAGITANQH